MNPKKQETIFSGIQPSGDLHIGHYFGAIKNWVALQNQYRAIFCVVDEHAITVPQDPKKLRERTLDIATLYLAAGIDPKRSIIFVQSYNQDHTQLGWILNTITPLGELYRMTQFKEKSKRQITSAEYLLNQIEKSHIEISKLQTKLKNDSGFKQNDILGLIEKILESNDIFLKEAKNKISEIVIQAGLLNYPTLMAADILLYQTDTVPVGEDQKQHVELARTLARKFNSRFGDTFKEPKELIQESGSRIMSLQDPAKKMSKSDENKNSIIGLLDSPDDIRGKIKIAVTDSGKEIVFEPEKKPAIANLITIYSLFSGLPIQDIEKKYKGKGYGEFKKDLCNIAVTHLEPLQKKYHELKKNPEQVMKILLEGAKSAKQISSKTLADAKQKIGFL